jgi:hypothetical protein
MTLRSAALSLLFLPALIGAAAQPPPRPRADGSALAGRPVLTAAELDALDFSSDIDSARPVDQATRAETKDLTLGVWVSRRAYREGEPIPVLFAVRNQGPARGLNLRIELTTAEAAEYNGARIHLERTDPGNTWRPRLQRVHVFGSKLLTAIDRGGYHCSGGDLRALGGGQLPAGAYRLSWGYRGRKSNAVEFAVMPCRDGRPGAPLSRRPLTGIIELTGGRLEGLPQGDREHSLRLTGARATHTRIRDLADPLARGVAGKYYPSLADLPEFDGGLQAEARFLRSDPAALPFAVEITLRAARGRNDLVLARDLHLALLVEPQPGNRSAVERRVEGSERAADKADHNREFVLDRPLVLRVDLPKGWERHARLTGLARVAVLVSTERLHGRDSRAPVAEKLRRAGAPGQEWRGVLRSPWLEVVFPSVSAKASAGR